MNRQRARLERLARVRIPVAAIAAAVVAAQWAACGVANADDRQDLGAINHRLASLARVGADRSVGVAPSRETFAPSSPDVASSVRIWPWRIPIAFVRAGHLERALHLRTNAIDANFWGVFSHGRGVYLKLSLHFD